MEIYLEHFFAAQRLALPAAGGEQGSETENCQTSEKDQKNAPSPSRPAHAVLGVFSVVRLTA